VECELPDDFWEVDSIVYGPYRDALKQKVFLARVSGISDFGEELDRVLWEMQAVDLPQRMQSAFVVTQLNPDEREMGPPEQALLDEAYDNACKHIRGFRVDSGLNLDPGPGCESADALTSSESDDLDDFEDWNKAGRRARTSHAARGRKRRTVAAQEQTGVLREDLAPTDVHAVSQPLDSLSHFISAFRRRRKTVRDLSEDFSDGMETDAVRITSCVTGSGVQLHVGGSVLFNRDDSTGIARRIGLVITLPIGQEGTMSAVEMLVYDFIPIDNWDEYGSTYPARDVPHVVLQTAEREVVELSRIERAVTLITPAFWERPFIRLRDYFLLAGHRTKGSGAQVDAVSPLASSPLLRTRFAHNMLGSQAVAQMVEMIRRNLQYHMTLHLNSRPRVKKEGVLDSLSLDNVPTAWLYQVVGHNWVAAHPDQVSYNAKTRVHCIGGRTADFVSVFGDDIRVTPVSITNSVITEGVDALLTVTPGSGSVPEVLFRWTPKKPGVLLVSLGGVMLQGPVQPDGSRHEVWHAMRGRGQEHQ